MPEASPADDRGLPLLSRRVELENLVEALRGRRSRLLTGPIGSGKTRLLQEALQRTSEPYVLMDWPPVLHSLLVSMAEGLGCCSARASSLRLTTSQALKSMVKAALQQQPRCIVLEDAHNAEPRTYRFLQEIYHAPGCSLVVTAPCRERLGHLHKLLWDPREEIALKPLTRVDARRLFEEASCKYGLSALNLDAFRSKVLTAARGNPGQIVTMCRLASRAEYQDRWRIKFLPLRIDTLTEFVS